MNDAQRAAAERHGHDAFDMLGLALRALRHRDDTTAVDWFTRAAHSTGLASGALGSGSQPESEAAPAG